MMQMLVVTQSAQADLEDIARYTESQWGAEQKQRYLQLLAGRFVRLTETPQLGIARDDVKAGYRSLFVGHHIVFYRLADDRIEILRILHERMDIHRHLTGDE